MLLFKLIVNKEIKFINITKDDNFVINHNELDIEIDGFLEFYKIKNKWFMTNKFPCHLWYGTKILGVGKSAKLCCNKKIKHNGMCLSLMKIQKNKLLKMIKMGSKNSSFNLNKRTKTMLGRSLASDIILDNPQIDLENTVIYNDGHNCYIEDLKSSNGLYVNNKKIKRKCLENYDVISLPAINFVYLDKKLIYAKSKSGIRIDVMNLNKRVKDIFTKETINLVNDVSFTINEGEYVAVVGGSGAGKTTILDCINGRKKSSSGDIFYDFNAFKEYQHSYQNIIGYVPQRDIMHTELTIKKNLYYYAKIRMHHKLSKNEIIDICDSVMKDVHIEDKANVKISNLSGGQRKRVSIAMELLSSPKVLFLDEPTSGLSPDLDYEIMSLLKDLSQKQEKTIVVITHNMDNIDKCDKLIFLGVGGRLCYYGNPANALSFFSVEKYCEIFNKLKDLDETIKYERKLRTESNYNFMIKEHNYIKAGDLSHVK